MNAPLRLVPALVVGLAALACACGSAENANTDRNGGQPSGGASETSSPENPTTDEELPAAPFCQTTTSSDPARLRFAALAPEPRAEYIALRQNNGSVPGGLTDDMTTVAERGQLCAGAADATKCKAAYEKLRPEVRAGYQHCFTRGDTVGCVETKAQAIAFLGTVKSIEEAFWLAEFAGYYGVCSHAEVASRAKRLADGSFQLAIMKGGGCSDIYRAVINVKPDGSILEIESKKTDLDLGCP